MALLVKKPTADRIAVLLSRGVPAGTESRRAPAGMAAYETEFDGTICLYGVWLTKQVEGGAEGEREFDLYNQDGELPYVELDLTARTAAEYGGTLPLDGVPNKRYFRKSDIRGALYYG